MQRLIKQIFWPNQEEIDKKEQLLVYFLFIVIGFALLYTTVAFALGMAEVGYGLLIDVFIFCILLALIYWLVSYRLVALIFIFISWLTCIGLITVSGGIHSIVIPWLTVIPIFALMLLSRKWAWIWAVTGGATILFFLVWNISGRALPFDARTDSVYFILPILLGVITIVTLIIQVFDGQQRNLLALLASTNLHLKTSEEELKQNLEEMMSIQEMVLAREQEIRSTKMKLEEYAMILMGLAKSSRVQNGMVPEALEEICVTATSGLSTSRVSVWLFENNPNRLVCAKLFDRRANSFSADMELSQRDYPAYFEALRNEKIICAEKARQEPATTEFTESYLLPLHIFSMLDSPFFLDGKLAGVLCCEHTETMRSWTAEDIIFVKSLADIISLTYKAAERLAYQKEIKAQRDEIARMNAHLEERVRERTLELEKQNQQLTEYAFINSHLLRAPLTRILGLINLLNEPHANVSAHDLIQYIQKSGEELDSITRRINEALDKGEHFNRQDFGK